MNLKLLLLSIFLTVWANISIDLPQVRVAYREASHNEGKVKQLHEDLLSVSKTDNKVLVAYKGAVITMMAKYATGVKDKKNLFKDGAELLEYAIELDSNNVEIRCIRLSVQENVPKITGYNKNIKEDKNFILENFDAMDDKGAKNFVSGYASESEVFNEAEKQLLQGP